jgi:hypothetical protein
LFSQVSPPFVIPLDPRWPIKHAHRPVSICGGSSGITTHFLSSV